MSGKPRAAQRMDRSSAVRTRRAHAVRRKAARTRCWWVGCRDRRDSAPRTVSSGRLLLTGRVVGGVSGG